MKRIVFVISFMLFISESVFGAGKKDVEGMKPESPSVSEIKAVLNRYKKGYEKQDVNLLRLCFSNEMWAAKQFEFEILFKEWTKITIKFLNLNVELKDEKSAVVTCEYNLSHDFRSGGTRTLVKREKIVFLKNLQTQDWEIAQLPPIVDKSKIEGTEGGRLQSTPKIGKLTNGNITPLSESKDQKSVKPPLSPIRISGEILAGVVGGTVLGIVGYAATFGMDEGILSGIGYLLGSSISVYKVGNIGNQTGSFSKTIVLGWAAGFGAAYSIMQEPPHSMDLVGAIIILTVIPIGNTIGFNLTRRYKSPPAFETALINFKDGQMNLAVPTTYFRPDSFVGITQRVNLLRVRF